MSGKKRKKPDKPQPGLMRSWEGPVGADGADRADRWFAETQGILTRSQIKARSARFFVAGREIKVSRPLAQGEILRVEWVDEPPESLVPEDISLALIHSDDRCFVVDKPQGMVTHPGHGNRRGTLANAVLFLDAVLRKSAQAQARTPVPVRAGLPPGAPGAPGAPLRGGIVHRLDKDTSGVIIVARDAGAQEFLAAQFRERRTRKEYFAVTCGIPPTPQGRIEDRLARDPRDRKRFASCAACVGGVRGKPAVTEWKVLVTWKGQAGARGGYALVALYPHTGRTHQLRVHMAGISCPILGDPIYGRKDSAFPEAGLHLHARRLRITLPGNDAPSLFRAPLPEGFHQTVRALDVRFDRTDIAKAGE